MDLRIGVGLTRIFVLILDGESRLRWSEMTLKRKPPEKAEKNKFRKI